MNEDTNKVLVGFYSGDVVVVDISRLKLHNGTPLLEYLLELK